MNKSAPELQGGIMGGPKHEALATFPVVIDVLLEAHELCEKLFQQGHVYLERQGIKIGTGTIVDATIISAPPSTKNKDKSRDPDMHQTKKGNQWYFGMKAHIGVDSQSKVIHAVAATPANVHDSVCLPDLLQRGGDPCVGRLGLSGARRGHPRACR
jgi:transposase, IS5 family